MKYSTLLLLSASVGFGRLKQTLPDGIISRISDGQSSYAEDNSLTGSLITGFCLLFGKLRITTTASYDFIKFQDFKYDIQSEEPGTGGLETIPDNIISYPVVDLGGLYVKGTMAFQLWD